MGAVRVGVGRGHWDDMRYPLMKGICIMIWEYIWIFSSMLFIYYVSDVGCFLRAV